MRHLYARHADVGGRSPAGGRLAERRCDPHGSCRQPLPLHRLCPYRSGGGTGGARPSPREAGSMKGDALAATLVRPRTPAEACRLLERTSGALPLAGGTDAMVAWNAGELSGRTFVDVSGFRQWARIRSSGNGVAIGALATHTAIIRDPMVRRHIPLLAAACATVGGVQIQNRGRLGGNIANASPAGDTFPPLAV